MPVELDERKVQTFYFYFCFPFPFPIFTLQPILPLQPLDYPSRHLLHCSARDVNPSLSVIPTIISIVRSTVPSIIYDESLLFVFN